MRINSSRWSEGAECGYTLEGTLTRRCGQLGEFPSSPGLAAATPLWPVHCLPWSSSVPIASSAAMISPSSLSFFYGCMNVFVHAHVHVTGWFLFLCVCVARGQPQLSLQGSSCVCLPSTGSADTHSCAWLFMTYCGSNRCLYDGIASVLPSEPSLQHLLLSFPLLSDASCCPLDMKTPLS